MGLEWLAIVMFILFFVLILYGYPVAFSFAGTALVFMLIGWAMGIFNMNWLKLLPNRWFGTMSDFTLLAIVYFVFMARSLKNPAWPNGCSRPLAFCSAPCGAGWPWPLCWWGLF